MLQAKVIIDAILKGTTSNKPVSLESILAKADNDKLRADIRSSLDVMAKNMNVMSAKITKKGVEQTVYWESAGGSLMLPFKQLHPHRTISARIY